jgi:hypothetical protein
MLLPRSHEWTPLQKRLIIASTFVALVMLSVLIYRYERYHRGPDDQVLVGSWEVQLGEDEPTFFQLKPDHTFEISSDLRDPSRTFERGVWYAGGKFAYLRRPTFDELGNPTDHPLLILRLDDISPAKLEVRFNPQGIVHTFTRVDPMHLTNRSSQPLPGK